MSKFEWMELETLSNEIAHAQSRLDAARASQNHGMVRLLEGEIADAAKRRANLLADITNGLSSGQFAGPKPRLVTVHQSPPKLPVTVEQPSERVEPVTTTEVRADLPASTTKEEGAATMWDKLTGADLERIKRGLATRRSEILARHAEELKALDAEQGEIDTIEQAIAAFAQKFKLSTSAEVVPLDAERVLAPAG